MTCIYPAPCCCCDKTCTVFSDEFGDDASSTLNGNWSEESGNWEYTGTGLLKENGTAGACVLSAEITDTKEQKVSCEINGISVGDKVRIIANAVDVDNHFFVELEQRIETVFVRFYRRKSGSDSLLYADEIGPQLNSTRAIVQICISEVSFTLWIAPTPALAATFVFECKPKLFDTGKRGGLGNGGQSTVEFGSFALGNFKGEEGGDGRCLDEQCCEQQCMCCDSEGGAEHCIPRDLVITLKAGGGCSHLDEFQIPLAYVPGEDLWRSRPSTPSCFENLVWEFFCDSPYISLPKDPNRDCVFGLMIGTAAQGCLGDDCTVICDWQTSYSCEPFEVTFPAVSYEVGPGQPFNDCMCCDPDESGSLSAKVTAG